MPPHRSVSCTGIRFLNIYRTAVRVDAKTNSAAISFRYVLLIRLEFYRTHYDCVHKHLGGRCRCVILELVPLGEQIGHLLPLTYFLLEHTVIYHQLFNFSQYFPRVINTFDIFILCIYTPFISFILCFTCFHHYHFMMLSLHSYCRYSDSLGILEHWIGGIHTNKRYHSIGWNMYKDIQT